MRDGEETRRGEERDKESRGNVERDYQFQSWISGCLQPPSLRQYA